MGSWDFTLIHGVGDRTPGRTLEQRSRQLLGCPGNKWPQKAQKPKEQDKNGRVQGWETEAERHELRAIDGQGYSSVVKCVHGHMFESWIPSRAWLR